MGFNLHGVIYLVTNLINNKQYVGQTTADPQWYWQQQHLNDAREGKKKYLYSAIRKYGENNFEFMVICSVFDQNSLDAYEDYFIIELNTLAPRGYNMKRGGARGRFSDKMRQDHSQIMSEVMRRPSIRLKMSTAITELHQRPEYRAKLAETYAKPEVQARKRVAALEVHRRPGHRELRARVYSRPDVVERMSRAQRGVQSRPGVREANQRRGIAQFADPATRETARQRAIVQFSDPEMRAKISKGNSGGRWITNGIETRKLRTDKVPNGWWYGVTRRLPRSPLRRPDSY